MNKKLIALAIASAFVAPVAMADSGNVTIYGEFAASVDSVDGGGYGATSAAVPPVGGILANVSSSERRARVSSNNSFLGFKGSEDLGNGLSAIWQYEQSIAIDQQNINDSSAFGAIGGGNQSRRTTFVGLADKQWGTVQLGIIDTPFKTSTGPLDPFGQHTLADYRSIMGMIGGTNLASIRAQNAVQYISPNMSGFTVKALYSASNEMGNDTGNAAGVVTSVTNPHFYSISGAYADGPLYAALAYEENKGVPNTAAVSDFTLKNWRAGVGYKFGDLKIGLGYERIKGDGNTTGATAVHDLSRGAWYLPVSYQMGSNTLKLAYTKAGSSNQKNVAGADLSGSDGAKQWSLGVDHAMSKRTSVYALYTQVRNDTNGSYALGGGATGISVVSPASYGANPSGFSVGMIHAF
ncbi:MAG TPA: porin [Sulfuriferula sp.]|nr:porin [Sulfuriferula sp.]